MTDSSPLYLSLDQTRVLLTAVQVCMKLDGAALTDQEARAMAEEAIKSKEGIGGVARIDQSLAAARQRHPVLMPYAMPCPSIARPWRSLRRRCEADAAWSCLWPQERGWQTSGQTWE